MQRVKQDAIMDIISEFIFCEKQEPQRGRQPVQVPPMTLMQVNKFKRSFFSKNSLPDLFPGIPARRCVD